MKDISHWLEAQGLGKYSGVFEANEIDLVSLPELTEEDLREMSIPIGPRRKLLKAIRDLQTSNLDAEPESVPGATGNALSTSNEAERRQLTVMFADLVGSTELSQQLDPEDLRELNRDYQDAVTHAIERYEGYVARYMGDGVLAYFGFPQAHENDAERAVRAALEIVESVPKLDTTITLAVRVGIATGPVVVGDIIGAGAAQESAVVGETPNLAARLQGFAEPDQIVISGVTQQLVGSRFHFESLGNPQLKGLDNTGEIFQVFSLRDPARFGAERSHRLTPLVGRSEELEMLVRRWLLAVEGEGQVALLGGEPGIGKSRVVHALRERVEPEVRQTIEFHCSPFGVNHAFYPVIQHLVQSAGLNRNENPKEQEKRLKQWLGGNAETAETAVPLLGKLLSIATDSYQPLEMTPQIQKAETIAVLIEQLIRLSASGPILVVVEDAQWMDPTTWELLDGMTEAAASAPVFIVVTHRPEFELPWRGRGHVTYLSLNRLGKRDLASLVSNVAGGKQLSDELIDVIAEKTDGTPLFIEELTKSLMETGYVRDTESEHRIGDAVHTLSIPSTLQDALMARLDRLGPAKEIAQIGAVLGREFNFDLLSHLSVLDKESLEAGLNRLVGAELLSKRSTVIPSTYIFRHALVRDAAYSSLLISRRRALHKKAVKALEAMPANQVSEQHQLLAYHYEKSEHWSDAFTHIRVAAEEEAKDYAVQEASRLYEHALRLGERDGSDVTGDHIISVLQRLAELMFAQGQFADSFDIVSRMHKLAREAGDTTAEATALVSMATASMWLEDFDTAHEHADRAKVVAEQAGITGPLAGGAMLSGMMHGLTGRLDEAQVELDKSISFGKQSNNQSYLPLTYLMSSLLKSWTGQYDAAIEIADRGRKSARAQQQLAAYLRCNWARGTALIGKGDYDAALSDLREGLALVEKVGDNTYIPRYLNTLGWLFNECHAYKNAIEYCQRAVEIDRENKHATGVERTVFSLLNWADALLGLGDLQGAKEILDSAYGVAVNPRTHEWMRWRYTTHVFASLAQYWITAGDPRQADNWTSRCRTIAREKNSWKYISICQRLAGAIAIHAKDWDAANKTLLEAESIAKRIGHPNELWKVHSDLGVLNEVMGKPNESSKHRQTARSILVDSRESIKDKELANLYGTAGAARELLDG